MSTVAKPEEIINTLEAEIESLRAGMAKLERENKRLTDELAVLINRFFRKKSERLDPNQLRMFAEELLAASESMAEAPEIVEEEIRVKKRHNGDGHGRAPFPPHLPRETIELDLPEEERTCPDCGQEMKEFGVETTERGHIIPARMMVKRYVRKKYACPEGHGVRTPDLPSPLIDKCKYERSVYAHLAVAKYGDHLPLHRLSGIYKRHGFSLPKSTMWEMLQRVDEIAAQPILRQMRKELLEETHLQADETPVTVQLEDRKGSHKGYIWGYGIGKKRVFEFTMTRERDGPNRFLQGWKTGTLQTDGYAGYDEVTRNNELVRAGCWSHARRKVKEALETGSRQAVLLMRPIQRLFWIERAMKRRAERLGLDRDAFHELRLDVRTRLSPRVLARIDKRIQELWSERSTLPKSMLGKALTYLDNQREPLTRFVQDPVLEIHNNDSERALRHVVTGRKNWLFFGSPVGGRVGANLFSLIATCKALEINPVTYLEDILHKVDSTPTSETAKLTPWAWAEDAGQAERAS
jgi:transposase